MELIGHKSKLKDWWYPKEQQVSRLFSVLAAGDDNIFLMDDKHIGVGFMCHPLTYADEKLQERFKSFLNSDFAPNSVIQFILFRSPDIAAQTFNIKQLRFDNKNPMFDTIIDERCSFLRKYTEQDNIAKTRRGIFNNGSFCDFKLLVTHKIKIEDVHPSEKEIERMINLKEMLFSSLQSVDLHPREMTSYDYMRFMQSVFNWGENASYKHSGTAVMDNQPISEQILDYDVDVELKKDHIRIGEQYVKCLGVKKLPDYAFFGDSLFFSGDHLGDSKIGDITGNFLICCNLCYPDLISETRKIETKRNYAIHQAQPNLVKYMPALMDKKKDFDTYHESIEKGYKPIKTSLSIILFNKSEKEVKDNAVKAQVKFRESRYEIFEDKFIQLPVFLNSLPFEVDYKSFAHLQRQKTLTAEHVVMLLPVFSQWQGTGTFYSSLIARNGQLMSLSLHDTSTNKNLVIAAQSGSGKSFLVNELIVSYLSQGSQVWVIDAGKSYKKLNEVLGGSFIQFDEESKICLNPFEMVKNYKEDEDSIIGLLSAMASAKGLLSEFQIATLKRITADLWSKKGINLQIDDVYRACLENEDGRIKDLGQQLFPFSSEGGYGSYFAGKTNVDFGCDFTVLELDELNGRKHLRQVVLLQLIYQIQQQVFLGKVGRNKLVIVDEAWDLLKEGEVASFMEHAYRKFRKYGGSVTIATQSIADLYDNSTGRAIAENSANMFLLGQKKEAIEQVRENKMLSLGEGAFNMLNTVRTVEGAYSEIFVISESGMGIGRLIVNEYQKLLYSTSADDIRAINDKRDLGLSYDEAIKAVLIDRGLHE